MVLGRVVGAHGVRGQIRVRYFGDGPEHVLAAREIALADEARGRDDPAPQRFEIEGGGSGRPGEVRLTLRGVSDRDAAQALRGRLLLTDESVLEPLPEGEYYWYQLVGCRVESSDGTPVGTVREIWEAGAHDLLVIAGDDGRDRLVPTSRELMQQVDLAQGRIVVANLPGLLDPA